MNKNLLTEKYYNHLNEATWGERFWNSISAGLGKIVGPATAVVGGNYALDQILDFGREMIATSKGAASEQGQNLASTQRGTRGGSERINNMVSKPGENPADEYEKRLLNMYGDKDLQGMSTSKRNTILGREQSIAANINKKRMQSARAQLMSDPAVQAARKAYEDARKAAPKPQSGLTPEQMLKQKSHPTVKDAYDKLKAAEAKAMAGGGDVTKEYEAARSGYLATRRETSPMATYTKDYSGFSVGSGVGGKPIITGGSYVDPNSPAGRIEASIASGDEKDMARTPAGRLQSGKKMDWEYEEDSMKAREEAIGFNPRGMTEDQIRRRMEQLAREKVDADTAKMKKEIEAMPSEELDASVIRSTTSGPLANEYLDILRKQAETPDQRKKREDQELIRSRSAARGRKNFGGMGRPRPGPETQAQKRAREQAEEADLRKAKGASFSGGRVPPGASLGI